MTRPEPTQAEPRQGSDRSDVNQGLTVLSYLIAGVLVWGLLGWLADYLLGTRFLLPIGILLGAAGAVYLVIKRFGQLGADGFGSRR